MRNEISISLLFLLTLPVLSQTQSIDRSASSVTVRVFKSGLFSAFAHDHTVQAPIASGTLDPNKRVVRLTFQARELKIVDKISDSDRSTIETTMKGEQVLDSARFPEISFQSTSVEPAANGHFNVRGDLTLHGKTLPVQVPVSVEGGRYSGSVKLKQTDYGMTPVRIAGGTVRVKDEIEVSFQIVPAK